MKTFSRNIKVVLVLSNLIRNSRVCATRKNASKINKLTIVVGRQVKPKPKPARLEYVYRKYVYCNNNKNNKSSCIAK